MIGITSFGAWASIVLLRRRGEVLRCSRFSKRGTRYCVNSILTFARGEVFRKAAV